MTDAYDFSDSKAGIREWLARAIEMDVHPLTIFAWYFTTVEEANRQGGIK